MNPAQKIVAFVAGLVVVFAVAVWAGNAVGPVGGEVGHTPAHVDDRETR
jgi:hypothetical protein